MAKRKKKKRPPVRRVASTKQASDAKRASDARKAARREAKQVVPNRVNRQLGLVLDAVLAVIVLVFIVKSATYSGRARFLTDECFHTYVVEQIMADGNSPVRLSALYSGMRNNTHPLFHWVAAPFYLADGREALPYVNVVLCGLMLGVLYWLIRAWVSAAAARIAVAVALLFDVIYVCTQAFYVEMLSALTFMLAVIGLYAAFGLPGGERRRFDWRLPFLTGCGTGLCLLTKQTGYVVLPVLVVLVVFFLATLRWRRALGVVVAGATAVATFAVGMNALSEKPRDRFRTIYASVEREVVPKPFRLFKPAKRKPVEQHDPASDLQPSGGGLQPSAESQRTDARSGGGDRAASEEAEARKALQEGHGNVPREMFRLWRQVLGVPGLFLLGVCVLHLLVGVVVWVLRLRGKDVSLPVGPPGATAPLLLCILSLLVSAMVIGTAGGRHFIPTIPVLAACAGIAVTDLLRMARRYRTLAVLAVTGLLLVLSLIAVLLVPNYRLPKPSWVTARWGTLAQDAPQDLIDAAEAIRDDGTYPEGAVHSGWTSAAWYYSGHPATWGYVNVPQLNTIMLRFDRWRALKSHVRMGIRYYLISNYAIDVSGDTVPRGYTPQFFSNVTRLMRLGAMRVIYPAELAEQQDQLLERGVFDRLVIPGQAKPTIFDLPSGQYMSVPPDIYANMLRGGGVIWGNPDIRTIVVELDYRRYFALPSSLDMSTEAPEPPDR